MSAKNSNETSTGIKEALKKASTEMLVLFLLRQKPMYTYEMMATIEKISEGNITFNTLYQAIYRLQNSGYIEELNKVLSEANRVRIFYSITENGEKYLNNLISEYYSTIETINAVLSLDGKITKENSNAKGTKEVFQTA